MRRKSDWQKKLAGTFRKRSEAAVVAQPEAGKPPEAGEPPGNPPAKRRRGRPRGPSRFI